MYNEYKDQVTWYEVWEHFGLGKEFEGEFDTLEEAREYLWQCDLSRDLRIRRVSGLDA